MLKTKCAICGKYLIESGEHEGDNENEIIVNLFCPNCNTEVLYIINLPLLELNSNNCANCDECEHRSETCLCDISNNEDECPLINTKKG